MFVVGGGNYVEYQNINDYGKAKGLQRIIYGCTEIINPKNFVKQVNLYFFNLLIYSFIHF